MTYQKARELIFDLTEIAERVSGTIIGIADVEIRGLNTLDLATEDDLTYIGSDKYAEEWADSKAVAAVVTRGTEVPAHDPERRALIIVDHADLAMAILLDMFTPKEDALEAGIEPGAHVHASAKVSDEAIIMAGAVVGARAEIGSGTILEHHVWIGCDTVVGKDCHIRANAVVRERCVLGDRVSIYSNAVIGADGFGYRPDGKGGLAKMPHIGNVILGDDVEIGACSTIDRGKFGPTELGAHTKLDNHCHIAHNVRMGRGCVMAALSGIAGSTVFGDFAQIGGGVGVSDHLKIGNMVRIASHSGVAKDQPDGVTLAGNPAIPWREYWRMHSAAMKLPGLVRTLRKYVDPATFEKE